MASNRDWGVSSQSLTIPPFAGPTDPAIIIGPDIPPELVTYYSGTLVAVLIFRGSGIQYAYIGVSSTGGLVTGTVLSGVVQGYDSLVYPGVKTIINGTTTKFDFPTAGDIQLLENVAFVSQGRDYADRVSSTAVSGAIGAETVVLTSNVMVWAANRAYSVEFHHTATPAGGATASLINIRRTNLAGAVLVGEVLPFVGGFQHTQQALAVIRNATGAGILQNLVLTLGSFPAGTVTINGSVSTVRWLEIRDIGAAADYPNAAQI